MNIGGLLNLKISCKTRNLICILPRKESLVVVHFILGLLDRLIAGQFTVQKLCGALYLCVVERNLPGNGVLIVACWKCCPASPENKPVVRVFYGSLTWSRRGHSLEDALIIAGGFISITTVWQIPELEDRKSVV